MKRKIFTTLLSLPLVTTCLTSIVACSNNTKSDNEVQTVKPITNPLEATTSHIVSFRAQPGLEEQISFVGKTEVKVSDGDFFASVVAPSAYKNGYPVIYWEDENGEKVSGKKVIDSDLTVYPHFDDIQIKNCIGLSAIDDSTISINHYGNNNPNIEYSLDGRTFQEYDLPYITLKSGQSVYFKGNNPNGFSHSDEIYTSFTIGGSVSLIGNVMTLVDDGVGTREDIPCPYCFYRLFDGCSGIVSISSNLLPATELQPYSYGYMFNDCANLTDFPKSLLKVTSLYTDETYSGTMCCAGMFANCTGLKNIPVGLLNATHLSAYCYYAMFENCTGLTHLDSGILPATLDPLTDVGCYTNMFKGCVNITSLDNNLLSSETLSSSCYYGMFSGCLGLTDLSQMKLPAKVLADNCYDQMFYSCEELTKAPQMMGETLGVSSYSSMYYNCSKLKDVDPFPAGKTYTLATSCCQYMFKNCTALTAMTSMPSDETHLQPYCFANMFEACTGITNVSNQLHYTSIAEGCYEYMFFNCSNLETAMSTLPSSSLQKNCYAGMFQNCSLLKEAPNLPAQSPAESCYASMFYGCLALTKATIGITELNTTAKDCFALMFANCSALFVQYSEQTGFNLCIHIPEDGQGEEARYYCTGMFINTANHDIEFSYTPSLGQYCYYKIQS